MSKISAIIVDDEPNAIKSLAYTLKHACPNVELLASCNSLETAYATINEFKPQLIFLDIDLGSNNSFELLDLLPKPFAFKIIFVTAHNDFAIKAFKYSAIDYILKPVTSIDLIDAVQKINANAIVQESVILLKNQLNQKVLQNKIALNTGKKVEIVDINQILFFQADEHYSNCFLLDKRKIHVNKSIKEFEEIVLEKDFFRIHKSYLINLHHIVSYDTKENAEVILKNDHILPIAHKRKKEFFDLLNNNFQI